MNYSNRQHGQTDPSNAAFNSVELLVLIATVALLAATIGTALASTRSTGPMFQCLNNLRQLGLASRMYSEDNQDAIVFNSWTTSTGTSAATAAWVGGELDYSGNSYNTNTELLINHKKYPYAAYFGTYLKSASVFRCPADPTTVSIGGIQLPRCRSVSLNNFMGQNTRTWTTPSAFVLCSKANQMAAPANVFTFLDERPETINDGVFTSDPDRPSQMMDYPGAFHNGNGSLAFVDGHSESHRWLDSRTTPLPNPTSGLPINVSMPNNIDLLWLQQHVSEHK